MRINLGDLADRNKDPDLPAIVDAADWEHAPVRSHRWLEERTCGVARALLGRGLARGDRVAIFAANSADWLAVYFGAMRAGLIAVPVNWRFPDETVAHVLKDSGARFLFVDEDRRNRAPGGLPTVEFGQDFEAFLDPGAFETVAPEAGEVAQILYTSGSTGLPKGVPLTHAGHLWVIEMRFRATPEIDRHRYLVAAPLYHMNALASSKFLIAGHASMALLGQFSGRRYLEAVPRFGCTWLTSVPTMIALALQERETIARLDLSSVEVVTMGSAPATAGLFAETRRVFPNARIAYSYGTTEAGPCVFAPHPDGLPTPDLALGVRHNEVQLRLAAGGDLDAEEGELQMLCPANMPGYLNLPAKTAEAVTGEGYYCTGDVMRRDAEGFYYFVGRVDDMFTVNGENVWPSEVEKVLEAHPDIAQACLVPVPDPVRGNMPVAFVAPRPGAILDADGVKAHALAMAPAYMHPRRVHFLPELPLASTNKVDRSALAARAARAEGGAGAAL